MNRVQALWLLILLLTASACGAEPIDNPVSTPLSTREVSASPKPTDVPASPEPSATVETVQTDPPPTKPEMTATPENTATQEATAPDLTQPGSEPTATTGDTGGTTDTGAIPDPALFNVTWDDRSDFAAGLVSGAQDALGGLEGASVYHLDVQISDDYRRFSGQEEVHYTNREEVALGDIVFRLYPNLLGGSSTVSNVRVNGNEVSPTMELQDTVLRVPLATPLNPGESVVIALSFDVGIPNTPEANYGSFAYSEGVLALAHAYPILAEYEPEEGWMATIPAQSGDIIYASSSFYRARITTPADATLIASGVTTNETENGNTATRAYIAGPMRDFYIVASDQLTQVTTAVGETTINSYSYSNETVGEEVLEETAKSVETYNAIVGEFPFTELDMVETPNLALGIEYPGVVVLTSRLYDENGQVSGAPLQAVRESTVAHEVGHQWFYSVIGNDQLNEPWLDESMAQYITYRYYVAQYGDQGANGFIASLQGRWNGVNDQPIPIGLPVEDYTPQEYGAIVYGRGPIFVMILEDEIGRDTFDTFLRQYYVDNKFGISTESIFKSEVESVCSCDLTPLFEEWVLAE